MDEDKVILYIEDDPEARYLMADIIRYKGYIYLEASRGLDGIKLAKQHQPDLILIDLVLPDMQGYEVTTHLKNVPELADTPIIAITASTHKDVKEMVLTAGCDGYIPKPINVSEFIFKIEEFLAGRKDNLEPDEERIYLQMYNIQLVNRLKKKISELEGLNENLSSLNQELFSSKEELATYNDRLFYLNNLANYLRALDDPKTLLSILPAKIVEGFEVKRSILFAIEPDTNILNTISSVGIPLSFFKNRKIQLSDQFLQQLSEQRGILWIKDLAEIVDTSLFHFSEKLETLSFLIGNLSDLGTQRDSTATFKKAIVEPTQDSEISSSPKFLIFIDKGVNGEPFHTYEIRIIKSFLQSVGIIYENMVLNARLLDLYKIKAEQAITDGLTKVYNYRYFVQELRREVNRSMRYETKFSLMMIDIDHFKKYNDSNGHLEGDKVLVSVGKLLKSNTRTTDTVCRYGGEEFTIIMPGLEKTAAIQIAEKLRSLIEDYKFSAKRKNSSSDITISLGVATFPEDEDNPEKLLRLADEAMYRAKVGGRNRVFSS